MFFTSVIYVIFGFHPCKNFGLICILVKYIFFQNTSLPHPTQQIRLRDALAFFSFFIFFNWPRVKKIFPHQILFYKYLKLILKNKKIQKKYSVFIQKILKKKYILNNSEKILRFFPKNLKIEK